MITKSKSVAKYSGTGKVAHVKAAALAAMDLDGRAFHVGDYRRSAQMLKGMRRDQHGHAKNAQQQARVDALAMAMAAVFEADSHEFGVPFSVGYFVAGTK